MSRRRVVAQWAAMLTLTVIGWVLFRSSSVDQIVHFLTQWSLVPAEPGTLRMGLKLLVFSSPLIAMQLWQHWRQELLVVPLLPASRRVPIYGALVIAIVFLSVTESIEFIYFQF
jgi:alginate O-acetyltransferase complex protein AlgI